MTGRQQNSNIGASVVQQKLAHTLHPTPKYRAISSACLRERSVNPLHVFKSFRRRCVCGLIDRFPSVCVNIDPVTLNVSFSSCTQGGYRMSYFPQLPVCLCEHWSSNILCFILYTHTGWTQDVLPSASCLSVWILIHQHFVFHSVLKHRVDTRCLTSFSFLCICVNIDPPTLYILFHSLHTHRVDTRCLTSFSFLCICVNIDPVTLYVSFSTHTGWIQVSYFLQFPVCLCEHWSSNTLCFILYIHRVDTGCLTSFIFLSVCVNIDPVTLYVSFSTHTGWIQVSYFPQLPVCLCEHWSSNTLCFILFTHRVDTRCLTSLSFLSICVNTEHRKVRHFNCSFQDCLSPLHMCAGEWAQRSKTSIV